MTERRATLWVYGITSIPAIVALLVVLLVHAPVFFVGLIYGGACIAGVIASTQVRRWHAEEIISKHMDGHIGR